MAAKASPRCRMWSERRHPKGLRSSSCKPGTSGIRNRSILVEVLEGVKTRCWTPEKFELSLPKVLGQSASGGDLHEAVHQSWNVPQSQLIRTSWGHKKGQACLGMLGQTCDKKRTHGYLLFPFSSRKTKDMVGYSERQPGCHRFSRNPVHVLEETHARSSL